MSLIVNIAAGLDSLAMALGTSSAVAAAIHGGNATPETARALAHVEIAFRALPVATSALFARIAVKNGVGRTWALAAVFHVVSMAMLIGGQSPSLAALVCSVPAPMTAYARALLNIVAEHQEIGLRTLKGTQKRLNIANSAVHYLAYTIGFGVSAAVLYGGYGSAPLFWTALLLSCAEIFVAVVCYNRIERSDRTHYSPVGKLDVGTPRLAECTALIPFSGYASFFTELSNHGRSKLPIWRYKCAFWSGGFGAKVARVSADVIMNSWVMFFYNEKHPGAAAVHFGVTCFVGFLTCIVAQHVDSIHVKWGLVLMAMVARIGISIYAAAFSATSFAVVYGVFRGVACLRSPLVASDLFALAYNHASHTTHSTNELMALVRAATSSASFVAAFATLSMPHLPAMIPDGLGALPVVLPACLDLLTSLVFYSSLYL